MIGISVGVRPTDGPREATGAGGRVSMTHDGLGLHAARLQIPPNGCSACGPSERASAFSRRYATGVNISEPVRARFGKSRSRACRRARSGRAGHAARVDRSDYSVARRPMTMDSAVQSIGNCSGRFVCTLALFAIAQRRSMVCAASDVFVATNGRVRQRRRMARDIERRQVAPGLTARGVAEVAGVARVSERRDAGCTNEERADAASTQRTRKAAMNVLARRPRPSRGNTIEFAEKRPPVAFVLKFATRQRRVRHARPRSPCQSIYARGK